MTEPLDELDAVFQLALEHGGEISRKAAAAITKAGIHNARELIAFGRDNLYLEPDIGKWDVVTVDMWLKLHAPALVASDDSQTLARAIVAEHGTALLQKFQLEPTQTWLDALHQAMAALLRKPPQRLRELAADGAKIEKIVTTAALAASSAAERQHLEGRALYWRARVASIHLALDARGSPNARR